MFDELPKAYHDSAFLDRIHFYIPGWEVDIIRGEMFSDGYGFVVDYLAEILRAFRDDDRSADYKQYFSLDPSISARDRDGIQKTMSGLMKMLFPNHDATEEDVKKLLDFAIEGRKRVKDQIMRFDSTYSKPLFQYISNSDGALNTVKTLEEKEYPDLYCHSDVDDASETQQRQAEEIKTTHSSGGTEIAESQALPEGSWEYPENTKGVSFKKILIPYIKDAASIVIVDPFLRNYWQLRNLMELLQDLVQSKEPDSEINVHVVTTKDDFNPGKQLTILNQLSESFLHAGIQLKFTFDTTIHDRDIQTDTGWKIILGRGLDIFQNYDGNNTFSLQNTLQEFRACKRFGVTYLRVSK